MRRLIYWFYERQLCRDILRRPMPRHVGIILDGNRRHAQKQKLSGYREAYDAGADKLDELLVWCDEVGIGAVTLWVFSIDNLKRPDDEITAILSAVETKIAALAGDPLIRRKQIRIRAAGRLELLPSSTAEIMRRAEKATVSHTGLTVTIAIAYGGREEITDAMREFVRRKICEGLDLEDIVSDISPEAIDRHLYTSGLPDPDLIIRTSGELRLSGFLLWQSAQSELYFTDVNWPEFRRIDFFRAIRAFQNRDRRHGQ